MKDNLLHICFVLDESGSMFYSSTDVIEGFNSLIKEQTKQNQGECVVSIYRFADNVKCDFIGKPIQEIEDLEYNPGGLTAMNDGIGIAIDEIGKWLSNMDESERPSKNLIVIMTDGAENHSQEYTFDDVKNRIKHQEEKYNWSFVYMGTDLLNFNDANSLDIKVRSISGRANIVSNYGHINSYATNYRLAKNDYDIQFALSSLCHSLNEDTANYSKQNNINVQ